MTDIIAHKDSDHVIILALDVSYHPQCPAGAQDNATHVLMRQVECKRNSNGVPTAPKLRVRAVYTRIEPSGAHQTMTAERYKAA